MSNITTIKITEETKKRLLSLDLAEKNKTFDVMVNELITIYQKTSKDYKKDHSKWKEEMKEYEQRVADYNKEKASWDKLMVWAKSKGFKA